MTFAADEIRSQPAVWQRAASGDPDTSFVAASRGERMLIFGCGTSAFVAQAMAILRESAGFGETDWAYASEVPRDRRYDHVVAVTRSGTTTEVAQALDLFDGVIKTVVTGSATAPLALRCDNVVDLAYADERSVVQTRFPTTLLVWWRAALGEDPSDFVASAKIALDLPLPADPADFAHFVYLGRGWTVALAHEAALKIRECGQAWSESHPALDYRHGPISAATSRSLVVSMGHVDASLLDDVRATGATVVDLDLDPLGRLVVCQRLAVALGLAGGLDIDQPRYLTRSVVLES